VAEVIEPRVLKEEISDKKIHLIRHTYRLIGDKGMHRMTLQDVADSASVSKAVIVYYFKGKENLVLSTMTWVLGRVADRIESAIANADSPEAKIRAMIDVIFVDPERNRNFYLAYTDLVDYAARNERFNELSTTFRSFINSLYADVIRSGVRDGAFSTSDVDQAATVVRAIIDGLFLQWLQEETWRQLHADFQKTCTDAVVTYLKRPLDKT
jgi:TetR/AcrR family fatty acid metabolism transcriptional regulator